MLITIMVVVVALTFVTATNFRKSLDKMKICLVAGELLSSETFYLLEVFTNNESLAQTFN